MRFGAKWTFIWGLGLSTGFGLIAACSAGNSSKMLTTTSVGTNGRLTFRTKNGVAEKIIGIDELTPVLDNGANIPEKYRSIINAFGMMDMGCTATHIGNNIAVTAGHCFDAPEKRDGDIPCTGVKIKWGYMKHKKPFLISNCEKILAYQLTEDLDYAIFSVDQAPEAKVEADVSARVSIGTPITIFGFPEMRPLEWSRTCIVKDASEGEWGTFQFSHQCDTEPGNSGSTVLDDNTLKVIGIHDGGISPWNYATYITDTPISEYLNGVPPAPLPSSDTLPDLQFGPFVANEDKTLTIFDGIYQGQLIGNRVSFDVIYNIEEEFDVVTVTGQNNYSKELSGRGRFTIENESLPLQVSFKSDAATNSNSVLLTKIKYTFAK